MSIDKKPDINRTYYSNGRIRSIYKYKNGLLHGTQKYFFKNGVLKISYSCINGKKYGVYSEYNKRGELIRLKQFKNDVLEGTSFRRFVEKGNLKTITKKYRNGLLHGNVQVKINNQVVQKLTYVYGVNLNLN